MTIKNVPWKLQLSDTNCSKLLSESECNKTLRKGHYKTSRNKYERAKKAMKVYRY